MQSERKTRDLASNQSPGSKDSLFPQTLKIGVERMHQAGHSIKLEFPKCKSQTRTMRKENLFDESRSKYFLANYQQANFKDTASRLLQGEGALIS